MRRFRGFTLTELLVTLTLMGILGLAVVPLAQMSQKRQQEQVLRTALAEIREALDAYKSAVDKRLIIRRTTSGYPPDLRLLVSGEAATSGGGRHYFLRTLPRDPFHGNPRTPAADTWGLRSYASPPDNPRPGEDVYDIYSLSNETGLNGIPYREW